MKKFVAFSGRDSDIDHIIVIINYDSTLHNIFILLLLQLKCACKIDVILTELGLNRDQLAVTLHSTIISQIIVTCLNVHLQGLEAIAVPSKVRPTPAGD